MINSDIVGGQYGDVKSICGTDAHSQPGSDLPTTTNMRENAPESGSCAIHKQLVASATTRLAL